jgi:hypothetical protein
MLWIQSFHYGPLRSSASLLENIGKLFNFNPLVDEKTYQFFDISNEEKSQISHTGMDLFIFCFTKYFSCKNLVFEDAIDLKNGSNKFSLELKLNITRSLPELGIELPEETNPSPLRLLYQAQLEDAKNLRIKPGKGQKKIKNKKVK